MAWQVGDKIGNQYEVYKILKGGFGIVYICYVHKHKTPFALKTLQEKYLLSEDSQKLFEREALIWTELERYPYIVRAYWVEKIDGRLFIVLEYVAPDNQGRNTLTHYIGNISLPEILKFSIQFCYGMEYAYSKGVDAHRDIKPDNIMITSDKTVKITDFGIAKSFQEIELKEEIISSEQGKHSLSIFHNKGIRVCGTLPYMAPEQFDGYADARTDIYSFGIVLFQMATDGKFPFIGRMPIEFEILHKNGKVPSISSPIFPIIKKCLEKDPNKRFQNFANLRKELENLLLKETGEVIPMPKIEELKVWELVNKGMALGNLGKYQEAIACCDEAIRINSRSAEAWVNKGMALGDLSKYQEAIACYDEAIKINSRDAEVWNNKGIALKNLSKYQDAITCYDEAIRINPRYAGAWSNKGVALGNLCKYQEEIVCYDEAIKIDPRYAEVWCNKGTALGNLGKCQEAIACYNEAIKINSRDAEVWNNKGIALKKLGKYQEALVCCDEAIRLNPMYSNAHQAKQIIIEELKK